MLPPVPPIDGPLQLDLVYPPEGGFITATDSTFVFGSTGSGRTQLSINGQPVRVEPNGAFLGFLPVPADGVYRLEATKDSVSARLDRTVRVPAPVRVPVGVEILPGTAYPTGAIALPRGETLEVGFRGTAGGRAWLRLPSGVRIPVIQSGTVEASSDAANFRRTTSGAAASSPVATYRGTLMVSELLFAKDSAFARPRLAGSGYAVAAAVATPSGETLDVASRSAAGSAIFELVVGADSVTAALPLDLTPLDPARPRVGRAQAPAEPPSDWTLRARNAPSGPYHYFWPARTRLHLTGERNGMYRVRLGRDRSAWVPVEEVQLLAEGTPPPVGSVTAARMARSAHFVDLRVGLPEAMPFHVEEEDRALHLWVFGATSRINFFQYGELDPLIERAEWSQPEEGVLRITVRLEQRVWGYETFFDVGGALVLRIRRPPRIDASQPFAGLVIAVDAGHPPAGATGPTRLTEAEANLAISLRLQHLLEQAGARVLMTRKEVSPVELGARPRMARDSNAHVLVSVHNNAFPDGVNPFENNGTSVYYFHPQSVELAQLLQGELLSELGLRDLGIGRADLALARPTWMPSALTETSFMMVPQHEAALRDANVQERIARAHFRAIEAFLRTRAGG